MLVYQLNKCHKHHAQHTTIILYYAIKIMTVSHKIEIIIIIIIQIE